MRERTAYELQQERRAARRANPKADPAKKHAFTFEEISVMKWRLEPDTGYIYRWSDDWYRDGEHRLVMTAMLGRPLRDGESVHHKNGNRSDNHPDNLELWVGPIRHGARAADLRCPHCGVAYLENAT